MCLTACLVFRAPSPSQTCTLFEEGGEYNAEERSQYEQVLQEMMQDFQRNFQELETENSQQLDALDQGSVLLSRKTLCCALERAAPHPLSHSRCCV